jgi:hypothetical protein
MAEMNGFERQRLLVALMLAVMALFVASGSPFAARWRPWLRRAAIIGFAVAAALALGEIAVWLTGSSR